MGGGGSEAQAQAEIARVRQGFVPSRWTRRTWLVAALAFTPLMLLAIAALLVR